MVAISSMIGVAVGAISGFRGGLVDDLLMRATEAVQTVPRFFLAVVVVALFGPGLDRLILLLGLSSWPMLARVVRAQVLSLKQQEYVEAARLLGRLGPPDPPARRAPERRPHGGGGDLAHRRHRDPARGGPS